MLGPIVLLRSVGVLCKRVGTCIVRVSVGDHILSFQRPLTTERKYIVLSSGQRCRLRYQSLSETHATSGFLPSVTNTGSCGGNSRGSTIGLVLLLCFHNTQLSVSWPL